MHYSWCMEKHGEIRCKVQSPPEVLEPVLGLAGLDGDGAGEVVVAAAAVQACIPALHLNLLLEKSHL